MKKSGSKDLKSKTQLLKPTLKFPNQIKSLASQLQQATLSINLGATKSCVNRVESNDKVKKPISSILLDTCNKQKDAKSRFQGIKKGSNLKPNYQALDKINKKEIEMSTLKRQINFISSKLSNANDTSKLDSSDALRKANEILRICSPPLCKKTQKKEEPASKLHKSTPIPNYNIMRPRIVQEEILEHKPRISSYLSQDFKVSEEVSQANLKGEKPECNEEDLIFIKHPSQPIYNNLTAKKLDFMGSTGKLGLAIEESTEIVNNHPKSKIAMVSNKIQFTKTKSQKLLSNVKKSNSSLPGNIINLVEDNISSELKLRNKSTERFRESSINSNSCIDQNSNIDKDQLKSQDQQSLDKFIDSIENLMQTTQRFISIYSNYNKTHLTPNLTVNPIPNGCSINGFSKLEYSERVNVKTDMCQSHINRLGKYQDYISSCFTNIISLTEVVGRLSNASIGHSLTKNSSNKNSNKKKQSILNLGYPKNLKAKKQRLGVINEEEEPMSIKNSERNKRFMEQIGHKYENISLTQFNTKIEGTFDINQTVNSCQINDMSIIQQLDSQLYQISNLRKTLTLIDDDLVEFQSDDEIKTPEHISKAKSKEKKSMTNLKMNGSGYCELSTSPKLKAEFDQVISKTMLDNAIPCSVF